MPELPVPELRALHMVGVEQVVQSGEAQPDASTLLVNFAGTALFAALFVADQRAASARVERRTQVRPRDRALLV